jgi:cell wall-associated NlpC family hydrolase
MSFQLKRLPVSYRILILVMVALASCKPVNNPLDLTRFLVDSIQSQSIPDTRVDIFSVTPSSENGRIILRGKTTNPHAVSQLENQLTKQKIAFTDSILRLPDPALGDKTWGLVTLSVANLRYNPAQSAEMATQALMGTPVRVLQEDNGYYLVQTPDRYIAWTESAGVALKTEAGMEAWRKGGRTIFLGDFGLVRESSSDNALPVSDIVLGGILSIDSQGMTSSNFLSVVLPDGRKGFINKGQCRDFHEWAGSVTPDTLAMVKVAETMMGRPYLWGGTSVKAFDCSGFTKSIYLTAGMILARDASQQVHQGDPVDPSAIWQDLKCGDLLFFGRKANGPSNERVSHVGMYIGNSEFIHCSGLVKINSLDSTRMNYKPYYRTNLLHVKRMIGAKKSLPVTFLSNTWYF